MPTFSDITPLPERASGTKPDADGELWNTRYDEIDANFDILEGGSPGEFWGAGGSFSVPAGTGVTNGHVIEDEGTPLTQRANLDFIGPIVQAADGVSATEVTINGDSRHPVKHIGKTAAPTVNDDGTAGYLIGDRWIDETNDAEYVCLDISTGAAVWTETTSAGGAYDLAADINAATSKATPVDADEIGIVDSEAANGLKKLTWANLKATLKTYLDTLYVALTGDQTVAGIKTFSSFPVTPSSAPTTDYQVANKKYVDDNAGGGGTNQNDIINPEFAVAQRGTTFDASTLIDNSDGNYTFDRWVLLSDGDDIVDLSQLTSGLPTGIHRGMKATVQTINKQFGFLQILTAANSAKYLSGDASLRFYAKMGAADDNTHSLKANVLAWNGTADSPTKDVVATWGATVTLATNWTAENTASSNTLTTSWQEFTIEGISVDTSGMTNVAVFIYCDQTDGALADEVYLTQVKLENSATATAYAPRLSSEEIVRCQAYCYVWGGNDADEAVCSMWVLATTNSRGPFALPVQMIGLPTFTISSASDFILYNGANESDVATSLTVTKNSPVSPRLTALGSGFTVGAGFLAANTTLSARMIFDAEIGV